MTSEGSSQDFFALFGLQKSFVVDEHRLNSLREKLLSETHPDRFVSSTESQKKVALKYTKIINLGFSVLVDPVKRGVHLCHLSGIDLDLDNFRFTDQIFLEKQLEIREEIEEVKEKNIEGRGVLISSIEKNLASTFEGFILSLCEKFQIFLDGNLEVVNDLKNSLAIISFIQKVFVEIDELKRSLN